MSLCGTPFKPATTARGITEKAATLEKHNIYKKNKFFNFVLTNASRCRSYVVAAVFVCPNRLFPLFQIKSIIENEAAGAAWSRCVLCLVRITQRFLLCLLQSHFHELPYI